MSVLLYKVWALLGALCAQHEVLGGCGAVKEIVVSDTTADDCHLSFCSISGKCAPRCRSECISRGHVQ
jgi:hypothetical protein